MKLSLRGEYALRALLVLGLNYKQSVVRIQTISQQQNIPKRFLEQILNDLKSAGVVESRRGVAGGVPPAPPPPGRSPPPPVPPPPTRPPPAPAVHAGRFSKKSSPPESTRR